MIGKVIVQYLSANKRLVIPGFGTFIRKDTGGVVFVELLKKDDQVLASLLQERYSVGEQKAYAIISEFVSEVTAAIDTGGQYVIEGLGVMRRDGSGVYELTYDPAAVAVAVKSAAPAESHNIQHQEHGREQPEDTVKPRHTVPEPTEVKVRADEARTGQGHSQSHAGSEYGGQPGQDTVRRPATATDVPQSGRHTADKDIVKDLRYQKPVRQDDNGKKKRADLVMIIAIVAALIAIASMVFGLLVKDDPVDSMRPTNPVENVETVPADTTAAQ